MVSKKKYNSDEKLKSEISSLVQYIRRFRQEISHMYQRQNDQTHFEGMADQLDAITLATEKATDVILSSVEEISDIANKIKTVSNIEELPDLCDKLNHHSIVAMESCVFQDITGQRVSKIISSMRFVEERVEALAEIWGKDDIDDAAVDLGDQTDKMSDDEKLLQGPQLDSQASINQEDIDKLFD